MLPFDYQSFVRHVTIAAYLGLISEDRIDDAVLRILKVKFELGLFDVATDVKAATVSFSPESNRDLAREAVAKSMVLLKNEANTLPISDDIKRIRVAGSAADNVGRQSGAWTVEWQGIDGNWLPKSTSILAGIKARAGSGTHIEYDLLGNFAVSSPTADIGIAVVGEVPYAEGVGDKEYPVLDAADLEVIEKLQATSKRVVVVIVSGRPLLIEHEVESIDALVAAWLPGSEGAGVADVLFGEVPFTGKLPLPWPLTTEQLPITSDGLTADGSQLLFPRYFGLE